MSLFPSMILMSSFGSFSQDTASVPENVPLSTKMGGVALSVARYCLKVTSATLCTTIRTFLSLLAKGALFSWDSKYMLRMMLICSSLGAAYYIYELKKKIKSIKMKKFTYKKQLEGVRIAIPRS